MLSVVPCFGDTLVSKLCNVDYKTFFAGDRGTDGVLLGLEDKIPGDKGQPGLPGWPGLLGAKGELAHAVSVNPK